MPTPLRTPRSIIPAESRDSLAALAATALLATAAGLAGIAGLATRAAHAAPGDPDMACPGHDLTGDGTIDGADLAALLGNWGGSGEEDFNGDGTVDGAEIATLLGRWNESSVQPGTFPAVWIFGGAANCAVDPPIQVHWYNDDLCILRQSLCTNFEGPFMYLLFGDTKVLMQDTGAGGGIQIKNKAFEVIAQWAAANGVPVPPLVVSHSHGHGDHVSGDSQFNGQPGVTVVGTSQTSVKNFFGIVTWPTQIVQYDLGNRIVDVIPIPGHQTAHIALYDRQTGILFTGDTLYPGRLYVSDKAAYKLSIQRMIDWVADRPVCHVLGTHIEMTNVPTVDYPMGATFHPNEHVLQLGREHLLELDAALDAMGGNTVIYQEHDDFIIFPLSTPEAPQARAGPMNSMNASAPALASAADMHHPMPADATAEDAICARPHSIFDYKRMLIGAKAMRGVEAVPTKPAAGESGDAKSDAVRISTESGVRLTLGGNPLRGMRLLSTPEK